MLRCNLTNSNFTAGLDSCLNATANLSAYSNDTFWDQFDFADLTGIAPTLGIGFTQWKPIASLGLKSPPSFVTQEVATDRANLEQYSNESLYYLENTSPLLKNSIGRGYYNVSVYQRVYTGIARLDDDFMKSMTAMNLQAYHNLQLLSPNSTNSTSAASCWSQPDNCTNTYKAVVAQLQNVTEYYSALECFKYQYPVIIPAGDSHYN